MLEKKHKKRGLRVMLRTSVREKGDCACCEVVWFKSLLPQDFYHMKLTLNIQCISNSRSEGMIKYLY